MINYNIKVNTIFIKDIDNGKIEKINYNFWKVDDEMDICEFDIDYLLDINEITHVYDKINYIEINNNVEIKILTYYFYVNKFNVI